MSIDRTTPSSTGKADAASRSDAAQAPTGFTTRQPPLSIAAAPVVGVSASLTQFDIGAAKPMAPHTEVTTLRAGTLADAAQTTNVSDRIRANGADMDGIEAFDAVGTLPAGIFAMPSLAQPIGANIIG
jgi:hypothetical protein